ncbi:carbohydrate ABC transporter permease [Clostridium gasigenes]|uniref:carbohydrate ABC transporter permease n=1 Tax=Clostridium gasigenes TaxID=94869 RepID=UPI001C0CE2D2|nr:sugar ABC transporter permease [Clostridium gasigenes]MBU3108789.1 sugar ABC transporter permease [Clostridium gasigenes]
MTGKDKKNKSKWFLGPALISIFIFTILPIMYTIYIACTDYTMYSQDGKNFVGFKNFIDVLTGPFKEVFLPVFLWTMLFAILTTLGCFLLGLVLALILNNPNIKESGIYKGVLIIPWALPATVAILSFQGLLNGSYGAINTLLMNMNIIAEPVQWLNNPSLAKMCIILVSIWLGFPYMMNVALGSLAAIPDVYYESAEMDGASKWKQFRHITLPSLTSTAYPLLISSFAFNFNNFGAAFLITSGGPPRVDTQWAGFTDILASVNYNLSTKFGRYDIAAALSILIFIVIATISYTQMKASGQFEEVD